MMKTFIAVVALAICGCANQPAPLTQEERDIQVFHEEPKVEYEILGRVDTTSRGSHAIDVVNKAIRRAAELGANGVIVHSILNKGTVAGGADAFGTGGGGGFALYQVQATAIRYVK